MYKNLAAHGLLRLPAACFAFFIPCAFAQPSAPAGEPFTIALADVAPLTDAGTLSLFKACAALLDNEGHDVHAGNQTFSGVRNLNMNFLVQGVQEKLNHSTPRSS